MAGPGDWGAVPLEQTGGLDTGPAAWGAQPLTEKPLFGTDEYVKDMAKRHGVDEGTVRTAAHSQYSGHVLSGVAGTVGLGSLVPKAGAAISAAAAPYTGKGFQGGTIGQRYGKERDLEEEMARDYERDHPILSTASELGGAALTGAGLVRAGAGPLIGAVGGGLARQIPASMAAGAGYGALDAALRGEDVGPAAGVGAGFGLAGPIVGRSLEAAGGTLRDLVRGSRPSASPQNVRDVGGYQFHVTGGEDTGNIAQQQLEQEAQRGHLGSPAEATANQFFGNPQAGIQGTRPNELEELTQHVTEQLDNTIGPRQPGQSVQSPYEAGDVVGQALRDAEQNQRQNYNQLYQQAAQIPGDIHAPFFSGITQRIQQDLSNRARPVIVDNRTTPVATAMLEDIERNIAQLRVPNAASPHGQPDPNSILGISMRGIEQMRQRLVSIGGAAGYQNPADMRAVTAVKKAFDQQVEDAVRQRLFAGQSDQALDAFRAARKAYSTHASLFTDQDNDAGVGRIIEQIVDGHKTPTEIANMLYGQAKIGATGDGVRFAQRFREIVGDDHPAWTAVKQGLFRKLVEPDAIAQAGGQSASGTVAKRIDEFLNRSGSPMAQALFSPSERQLIQNFGNLMRQITPRPGAVNYSNTAGTLRFLALTAFRAALAGIGESMSEDLGAPHGAATLGAYMVGGRIAHAVGQRSTAGRVARSINMTPRQLRAETMLASQMGQYGTTVAQAIRAGVHPAAATGGRQASDGNHYVADPTRPGKFLRIDDRRGAAVQ